MRYGCVPGMLIVLALATVAEASGASSPALELALQQKSKTLWLRPAVTSSRKGFLYTREGVCSFEYQKGRLLPARSPLKVLVKKVEGRGDSIEFNLTHETLGKTKLVLGPVGIDQIPESAVAELLSRVFSEDSASQTEGVFVGNRESHVFHAATCNHPPSGENAEPFDSQDEAIAGGYRACTICFHTDPDLSDYEEERMLGALVVAEYRKYNLVSPNDSLNSLVTRVGTAVLSKWPVPLKGYNYTFRVVESETPNAVACPGGQIFITAGLLDALESQKELESVLAHEIAHVELRHGYRQYVRAQNANLIATLAGTVAAVALATAAKNRQTAAAIVDGVGILSRIAVELIFAGYSRTSEEEADAYAIAYLHDNATGNGPASFVNVLRKLEFFDAVLGVPGGPGRLYRTHPYIADRISQVSGSEVRVFPHNAAFVGLDEDGNEVARIDFLLQVSSDYVPRALPRDRLSPSATVLMKHVRQFQVYATIETTPEFGENEKVTGMSLRCGEKTYALDDREDTEIAPGDLAGCVFVSSSVRGLLESPIDSITLPLNRVRRWVRQ